MNPAMIEAINDRTVSRTIKRLELELIRYGVQHTMPRWSVTADFDRELNEVVVRIVHYVYGIRKPIVKTAKFPKTWWDAFKVRFFPGWLLKIFAPQYDTVTLTATAVSLLPELEADGRYKILNIITTDGAYDNN